MYFLNEFHQYNYTSQYATAPLLYKLYSQKPNKLNIVGPTFQLLLFIGNIFSGKQLKTRTRFSYCTHRNPIAIEKNNVLFCPPVHLLLLVLYFTGWSSTCIAFVTVTVTNGKKIWGFYTFFRKIDPLSFVHHLTFSLSLSIYLKNNTFP